MSNQQKFTIHVRGELYTVEMREDIIQRMITYRISTDCNYLMTIYKNEQGSWSADSEMQMMDDSFVNDIGSAIEAKVDFNRISSRYR